MTPLVYSLAPGTFVLRLTSGCYHAVAPVGTAQVDAAAFTLMVAQWLSGVVGALPNEVREIDDGDCATDVSTLRTNAAAISHLVHANQAQGISVDIPETLKALFERRIAEEHGADTRGRQPLERGRADKKAGNSGVTSPGHVTAGEVHREDAYRSLLVPADQALRRPTPPLAADDRCPRHTPTRSTDQRSQPCQV